MTNTYPAARDEDFVYSAPNKNLSIIMSTNGGKQLGTFIVNDDGFYVFFSEEDKGYYNEYLLNTLLDKLRSLNKDWNAEIDELFKRDIIDEADGDKQLGST